MTTAEAVGRITIMITDMVATWRTGKPVNAEAINSGECSDFAEALLARAIDAGLTAVLAIDSSDLIVDGESKSYWHVWVYHDGRHYDAETPGGVSDWEHLPFFVRWRLDTTSLNRWKPDGYVRRRSREDEEKALRGMAASMARHQAKIRTELARVRLNRHLAMCNACKKVDGCSFGDELLVAAWG